MIQVKAKQIQSRRWTWTSFMVDLERFQPVDSLVQYLVVGLETCPSTKRQHLQGYLECIRKISFSGVKKILKDPAAHVEVSAGTAEQNLKYCQKEKLALVVGSPLKQGSRTDLLSVQSAINSGATMVSIADQNFNLFCQYRKSFEAYMSMKSIRRNWQTKVILIVGPTGCGKSSMVFNWIRTVPLYIHPAGDWWDGFTSGADVLLDDMASDYGLSYGSLLRVLDRYPMQARVKGGFINFNPRRIFITSNYMPNEWFKCDTKALERRICLTINKF